MGPGFESLEVHQRIKHIFCFASNHLRHTSVMQLTPNLLFVGRTRRMTQYTAFAVCSGSRVKIFCEDFEGSGSEWQSGGLSEPRKTERVVRARIESLEVHQRIKHIFYFYSTSDTSLTVIVCFANWLWKGYRAESVRWAFRFSTNWFVFPRLNAQYRPWRYARCGLCEDG